MHDIYFHNTHIHIFGRWFDRWREKRKIGKEANTKKNRRKASTTYLRLPLVFGKRILIDEVKNIFFLAFLYSRSLKIYTDATHIYKYTLLTQIITFSCFFERKWKRIVEQRDLFSCMLHIHIWVLSIVSWVHTGCFTNHFESKTYAINITNKYNEQTMYFMVNMCAIFALFYYLYERAYSAHIIFGVFSYFFFFRFCCGLWWYHCVCEIYLQMCVRRGVKEIYATNEIYELERT